MKNVLTAGLMLTLLGSPLAGAQPAGPPPRRAEAQRAEPEPQAELRRFSLDFPGGGPRELVQAIQKAMGRPINAIIPDQYADTQLPPLKMNDVTVPQLFTALHLASQKQVRVPIGGGFGGPRPFNVIMTGYGFSTSGPTTDDSIWHFSREDPPVEPQEAAPQPPKVCRFYQLGPYLDKCTVEDITTAIQTGWKMLGETDVPKLSFHKETKLLIAVGEENKLAVIGQVLAQLPSPGPGEETALHSLRQLRQPPSGPNVDLEKAIRDQLRDSQIPK